MRNKLFSAITLILCSLPVVANDSRTFLCIPEATTGFVFNKTEGKWEQSMFDTSDKKYLIQASTEDDKTSDSFLILVDFNDSIKKGDFVVRQFGDSEIVYWCDSDVRLSLIFDCVGMGTSSFVFNKTAGRYVRSTHGGYINSVLKFDEDKWSLDSMLKNFRNGEETAKKVADTGGNSPVIEIGQCAEIS